MSKFKLLLFPFAVLYDSITRFRNHLYEIGYKKSFKFQTNLINVGNLTVGGTGKTPMVEYLIELLKDKETISVLSRGYGRKTSGFRIANDEDSATTIGDEPYQYYRKYKSSVNVVVGEDRAFAIPQILHENPDTSTIILDDAFQHRSVVPNFNILLTDYTRLFYEDYVLPMGLLRESRKGANRADVIIVSKSPADLSDEEQGVISNQINKYARNTPVFFTCIEYSKPVAINQNHDITNYKNVSLFSGIANASSLREHVSLNYNLVSESEFGDHHDYGKKDIDLIKSKISGENSDACLLTTEKDFVKLIETGLSKEIKDIPIFYIPIKVRFLNNNDKFVQLLSNQVHKNEK